MIDTPLLTTPAPTSDVLSETSWTRHQIRGNLQAIQIGLHLLEVRLDMHENDVQADLIDLRNSLHKTARVMDTLFRLQQSRAASPSE
jgi:hypothetical protein